MQNEFQKLVKNLAKENGNELLNISFKDIEPRKLPSSQALVTQPYGHFDEEGYKKVAELIVKKLY